MANTTMTDLYGDNEERKALRAKVDQANKEASENWNNPAWRQSMAAAITESIYKGFEHENLLSLMAEVETLPFDGRSFVKEVRGLRAFWIARGGYIEASQLRANVMEIPRDTIGFHVYEFEDKLRTSFAETQATLVDLAVQRMDAEVNLRVLKVIQAALPTGGASTTSGANVLAGLTALNTALRAVRDTANQPITIVGRATMTDKIIDELTTNTAYAAFIPEINQDAIRRGILGTYRGSQIITLNNWKDDQDVSFFPANELYVIGRDASKFAFWGGLLSKEYVENDNWYWHYLARRDFGGIVHHPERIRRLIDTSIAP